MGFWWLVFLTLLALPQQLCWCLKRHLQNIRIKTRIHDWLYVIHWDVFARTSRGDSVEVTGLSFVILLRYLRGSLSLFSDCKWKNLCHLWSQCTCTQICHQTTEVGVLPFSHSIFLHCCVVTYSWVGSFMSRISFESSLNKFQIS